MMTIEEMDKKLRAIRAELGDLRDLKDHSLAYDEERYFALLDIERAASKEILDAMEAEALGRPRRSPTILWDDDGEEYMT